MENYPSFATQQKLGLLKYEMAYPIIFAIIIALTVLHDAHLIAFQPQINLTIAATIYLAVDARWRQTRKKEEN